METTSVVPIITVGITPAPDPTVSPVQTTRLRSPQDPALFSLDPAHTFITALPRRVFRYPPSWPSESGQEPESVCGGTGIRTLSPTPEIGPHGGRSPRGP